jgi:two-component system sensor kinase FixL
VLGPDFRVKFANPAIINLFGAYLSEGETFSKLASEFNDLRLYQAVLEVYKSGKGKSERTEIPGLTNAMGKRSVHHVDFHYQPITDSSGTVAGVLCMGFDVTPQVEAQKETDRLRHQVLHSSRINAMAMTLAHELSQPLAAAANYASTAKKLASSIDPEKREAGMSALEGTIAQIVRAGEIIRRMRSAMRSGEANRQPVLVTESVQRAWSLINSDDLDATLITDIAHDANSVLADGVQLEQVLTNLLRNAVDASHNAAQKDIVVTSRTISSGMVRISVRDFGTGVSSERIADILAREQKAESGGLGVGLSLSWTLIDANKGRLHAENAVGGGAIFSFDLEGA